MTDQSRSTKISRMPKKKMLRGKKQKNYWERNQSLPRVKLPATLMDAGDRINQLDVFFERSIHAHAYKYGVLFAWVQKNIGHGNLKKNVDQETFPDWVKRKTRWSSQTARRYMKHAEKCQRAGYIVRYQHTENPLDEFNILSIIDEKSQRNLEDAKVIEPFEEKTPELDSMIEKGDQEPEKHWTDTWAIFRIYETFLSVTTERTIEEKHKVATGAAEMIAKYVVGEQEAKEWWENCIANRKLVPFSSFDALEKSKDEAAEATGFDKIIAEMERIQSEVLEYDFLDELDNWPPRQISKEAAIAAFAKIAYVGGKKLNLVQAEAMWKVMPDDEKERYLNPKDDMEE